MNAADGTSPDDSTEASAENFGNEPPRDQLRSDLAAAVLDPRRAVRNDVDARILAILWCARKAFPPTMLFGMAVAAAYFIVVRDAQEFLDRLETLTEPNELAGAVLSPFSIIVFAIVLRIVVALAARAAAYPLAMTNRREDYPNTNAFGRFFRVWWDRWQMTSAFRAFRWTWAVRTVVLDRLGAWGTIWHRWDIVVVIANILLSIVVLALLTIASAQVTP